MKQLVIILGIVLSIQFVNAQEEPYPHIIKVDSTWYKEIFPFPIHFAPQIPFKGYEAAYFMPGWSNKDSEEFWSYAFVWTIENKSEPLTTQEVEKYLKIYFDGLMERVNKDKSKSPLPPTQVLLSPIGPHAKVKGHIGRIDVYDSFHTKKIMKLNFKVTYKMCLITNRLLAFFNFSLQDSSSKVWEIMENLAFTKEACR